MNNPHKVHKDSILGGYCWICRCKVKSGLPGWKKSSKGSLTRYSVWASNEDGGYTREVVWANGDIESHKNQGECGICGLFCKYPVSKEVTENGDSYKEILKSRIK